MCLVDDVVNARAVGHRADVIHEFRVGHQRHTELVSLAPVAPRRTVLVADHQRSLPVDRVGIGQPGVQDPLDQLLVSPLDLGRQRNPHALHQRSPPT